MTYPLAPLIDIAAGRLAHSDGSLVASAVEHRMSGLLLTAQEEGRISLSEDDTRSLAASDLATAARHRELWQVVASSLRCLDDMGIEAAAIKGVANEQRWYRRVGERPCADVDLVLAPHCVDRIDEVLTALAPGLAFIDQAAALVRRRQLQHVHFTVMDITVDLHLDPLKLGMWTRNSELWWSTTQVIPAPDGTPVTVLAPEIALAGALTHLNKDRFAYLGAYAEVARIAADPDLDWSRLARFVAAEGLDVPVWASLREVMSRLGLPLSAGVPDPRGWRRWLWERMWPSSSRLGGHETRDHGRKLQLMIPVASRGRSRDALAELQRSILPPRSLFAVHDDGVVDHTYLRRVTVDRFGATRRGQRSTPDG